MIPMIDIVAFNAVQPPPAISIILVLFKYYILRESFITLKLV
jgi:hypothetical protein